MRNSSKRNPAHLPTPARHDATLRLSYRIARGEQGVLTFEPYKSYLLPFWRFRTPVIARQSSCDLRSAFEAYVSAGDFVGADMARKFIQMGMTRARRYANYKGGRKYAVVRGGCNISESRRIEIDDGGEKVTERVQLEKSQGHPGREEKMEASKIFEAVWRECKENSEYRALMDAFREEQKEFDKKTKTPSKDEGLCSEPDIKTEDNG